MTRDTHRVDARRVRAGSSGRLLGVGYAQTGRIKGKVVDAENKPVEGAKITMESKEMQPEAQHQDQQAW